MTSEAAIRPFEAERFAAWQVAAIATTLGAASLAALMVGGGNIALALAPFLVAGAVLAFLKAELRAVALIMLLAVLVLPNPGEVPSAGVWKSPLYPLGAMLLYNLSSFTGVGALRFSGMDVVVAATIGLVVYRKAHGERLARPGQTETAMPTAQSALICIGSIGLLWIYGMATHGDVRASVWQAQKLLYIPVLVLLFQAVLLGRADHRVMARVVVLAACYKAIEALWVRHRFQWMGTEHLPYVNTHSDSILYATAVTILAAGFILKPSRRRLLLCAALLPLMALGMAANNRRIVWVELGAVALLLLTVLPRTRLKRAVLRALVVSAPILVAYLAIGWSSGSSVFKPAQLLKTVVSSQADRSTETRDVENYNLLVTLRAGLLLGTGYGHEYVEAVKGDDISKIFPEYRYVPHNSFLGILAFGGLVGYSGILFELCVGVFLAARALRAAKRPDDRVASVVVMSVVLIYLIQSYGDMGATSWIGVFLVATALALASKLAVATGAWPSRRAVAVAGATR